MVGRSCSAPTTSAVPSAQASLPGSTRPAPSGFEKSSPVPTATGVPAGRPVSAAPCRCSVPARSEASAIAGSSLGIELEQREQSGIEAALPERIDHGGRGEAVVEHMGAGEPGDEIGDRLMEAADRRALGRVALQPAGLGRHVGGVQDDAGRALHPRRRQARDLGLGAPVHPDEAGPERAGPRRSTATQPSSWPQMPSARTERGV